MKIKKEQELIKNKIHYGDCINILPDIPNESIDLIMTSPPYADQRKQTYGGIEPDKYVSWFLPKSEELFRILKPSGSFVLNIKEKVVNGERSTYVMELVLALKKQGWRWTEEYVWHKKNSHPGKWTNRFRDSWEHCFHFTKEKKFKMFQDSVMVPRGDWATKRLNNLKSYDKQRQKSRSESGFGKNVSNWTERELVYPSNVIHIATECQLKNHSAAFPITLPSWFIKLFTETNDIVLDPFVGSGTTALAALQLNRQFVGVESDENHYKEALSRLERFNEKMNCK